MPATWNDFTLVGTAEQSGAGTLYVSNVQDGDLIIAASTSRRYYSGYWYNHWPPAHTPGGIPVVSILERNSIPYEIGLTDWWYYPYWYWYWPYWYHRRYWYHYYRTITRVSLYKAAGNGTLEVTFSPTHSRSPIVSCRVSVWRPNVTVGSNETIKRIDYATSAQSAQVRPGGASIPVQTDELLLVMAKGIAIPGLSLSLSGVTTQNLFSYSAYFGASYEAAGFWRIKSSGTAVISAPNANTALAVIKIIPHVEIAHVSVPSVPPEAEYFYVELTADLLSNGRVVRPKWFEGIRSQYSWSNSLGLRKRWVKSTENQDSGRARVVELWKVPRAALSSVPGGEAYVFTSDQDAEARVLMHDAGW